MQYNKFSYILFAVTHISSFTTLYKCYLITTELHGFFSRKILLNLLHLEHENRKNFNGLFLLLFLIM